jgi:transposase
MAGKSPVTASDEQRAGLLALADSRDRGEADRARAVLLTLAGWTSSKIAEAFGVREDTVRLWRSDFTAGGVAALKTSIARGPPPVKSEAALRVVTPLLEEPVADRRNWTTPAFAPRSKRARACASAVRNCPRPCEKKFRWRRPRHTLKGRQTESEVERVGLRLQLRKQQAEAGDIILLYGDESEALTHPYLARAWAKSGADLRVPAPGQAKKVAMLGSLDHVTRQLIVHTSPTKRSSDFIAHLEQLDRSIRGNTRMRSRLAMAVACLNISKPRFVENSIGSNCCSSRSRLWRPSGTRCSTQNKPKCRLRRRCCWVSVALGRSSLRSSGLRDSPGTSITADRSPLMLALPRRLGRALSEEIWGRARLC